MANILFESWYNKSHRFPHGWCVPKKGKQIHVTAHRRFRLDNRFGGSVEKILYV